MAEKKKVSATATIKKLRAEKRDLEKQLNDAIKCHKSMAAEYDALRDEVETVKEEYSVLEAEVYTFKKCAENMQEELDNKSEEYQAIIRNLRHQNQLLEYKYNDSESSLTAYKELAIQYGKKLERDEFLIDLLVKTIKEQENENDQ